MYMHLFHEKVHTGTTSKLSIKMRRKAPSPTILIQLTDGVCLPESFSMLCNGIRQCVAQQQRC